MEALSQIKNIARLYSILHRELRVRNSLFLLLFLFLLLPVTPVVIFPHRYWLIPLCHCVLSASTIQTLCGRCPQSCLVLTKFLSLEPMTSRLLSYHCGTWPTTLQERCGQAPPTIPVSLPFTFLPQLATDFDPATNSLQCYSLVNSSAGEEFRIFYGPRSNTDLLLNSGFVFMANDHDAVRIKLGLSTAEEEGTQKMRVELLRILNLQL